MTKKELHIYDEAGAVDWDKITAPDFHCNVKGVYFNQALSGDKPFEYRLRTPYWKKRIEGREYKNIIYKHGYPKKGDKSKTLIFPWRGYELQTITHPHFGNDPVDVYAIVLKKEKDTT